jgi:hypothetical protein
MELISKLSMKGIGAQPKKNSLTEGESKNIAIVIGRVSKYEVGQSTFGEFTKFRGSFEATNVETGKVYKSGACFLPQVVEALLVDAVDNAPDNSAVDFALAIGVKFSETATGYEYTVEPLTELKEADELTALRQVAMKALPAPATADETAGKSKGKKAA